MLLATQTEVASWLRDAFCSRLGILPDEIDDNTDLVDVGIDSAMAMDIAGDLAKQSGREIDASLFFEAPTIKDLSELLLHARDPLNPRAETNLSSGPRLPVVGMACQLPGAPDLETFWSNLAAGLDGIGPPPIDRPPPPIGEWPNPAGYIEGIDEFDPEFFGLSDTEILSIDPQQRWLLRTVWEAVADAGLDARQMKGQRVGVFVGISRSEYILSLNVDDLRSARVPTGNSLAVAANRLSYVFGWSGPSLAVDTACSSSLVALDLAKNALRRGECDYAVVAGVNALLDPSLTNLLDRAGMLSQSRRCKTFDASADGYVRSEGCAAILVCSERTAARNAHVPYAYLCGSAVNQDGASNGLTAPNPEAQERLIKSALNDAGLEPSEIGYLETHGTGTPLGDPIEVRAASRAYRAEPGSERPLYLGAVKSNIGHLEAAAGIAGCIKACLSLHHRHIPSNLNFSECNPRIDVSGSAVKFAETSIGLGPEAHAAGVSSFGFGGTNAHAIFRVPALDGQSESDMAQEADLPILISANDSRGLRETAGRLADWLNAETECTSPRTPKILARLLSTKPGLQARSAIVAKDHSAVVEQLRKIALGSDTSRNGAGGCAFVFSGLGSEYAGMLQTILSRYPAGQTILDRCLSELPTEQCEKVAKFLNDPEFESQAAEIVQPAIFIVQAILFEELRSLGLRPSYVIGHSIGEVAAAYCVGAYELETATRIAACRGAALECASGRGGMLYLECADAEFFRSNLDAQLSIATVNSNTTKVVAGPMSAITATKEKWTESGKFAQIVSEQFPFHTNLCRDAAEVFRKSLGDVAVREPGSAWIPSSRSGSIAAKPDIGYLSEAIVSPVDLPGAIAEIDETIVGAFIEIGGQPILRGDLRRILGRQGPKVVSANTPHDDGTRHKKMLAELFEAGVNIRIPPKQRERGLLPGYPWKKRKFWPKPHDKALRNEPRSDAPSIVFSALPSSPERCVSFVTVDLRGHWLMDHRVAGQAVMPAAAFISLISEISERSEIPSPWRIEQIEFVRPMILGEEQARIAVWSQREESALSNIEIIDCDTGQLVCRAAGVEHDDREVAQPDRGDIPSARPPEELYARLSKGGIEYGDRFKVLLNYGLSPDGPRGNLRVAPATWLIDPRLIDGAFHLLAAGETTSNRPMLPRSIKTVRIFPDRESCLSASGSAFVTHSQGAAITADFAVQKADRVILEATSALFLRVPPASLSLIEGIHGYRTEWHDAGEIEQDASEEAAIFVATPEEISLPGSARACSLDELGEAIASLQEGTPYAKAHVVYAPFMRTEKASGSDEIARHLHQLRQVISTLATNRAAGVGDLFIPIASDATMSAHSVAIADCRIEAIRAFARTSHFECAGVRIRTIIYDPSDTSLNTHAWQVAANADDEVDMLLRRGRKLVRRVIPLTERPSVLAPDQRIESTGFYVVSGAAGNLGRRAVAWLLQKGASRVLALGRSGDPGDWDDRVTYCQCDVGDRSDVSDALSRFGQANGVFHGAIHCAGVTRDMAMLQMEAEDFAAPLKPKVEFVEALAALEERPEWLICFSSGSAELGSPGQANYAAANAAMSGSAEHLRSLGVNVLSVAWGPWAGEGMAGAEDSLPNLRQAGMEFISHRAGFRSLETLFEAGVHAAMILPFDLRDLVRFYPQAPGLCAFEALLDENTLALRNHGKQTSTSERPDLDVKFVPPKTDAEKKIALIVKSALSLDQVGLFDNFFELGGDSVVGNQILMDIREEFSVTLDVNSIFEDFSVFHIANLVEKLKAEDETTGDE